MNFDEFWVGDVPAQLRVRRYASRSGSNGPRRVVLIHGGSHTGACWVQTPDGRPGWLEQFLKHGYEAYVVDHAEIGKPYPIVDRTPQQVIDGLVILLQAIGPAVVVGHSIGGALAIKVTETVPELVEAAVMAAPASVEVVNDAVLEAQSGVIATMPANIGLTRLANASKFPSDHNNEWLQSLVGYSPHMRNAGSGATPEFKVNGERAHVWTQRPAIMLLAEDDLTVSVKAGELTAAAMGVTATLLGRDWNLPGHGHMFIVELESEVIAERAIAWLQQ